MDGRNSNPRLVIELKNDLIFTVSTEPALHDFSMTKAGYPVRRNIFFATGVPVLSRQRCQSRFPAKAVLLKVAPACDDLALAG